MTRVISNTAENRAILKKFGINLTEELEKRGGEIPGWMATLVNFERPRRRRRRSGRSVKVHISPAKLAVLAKSEEIKRRAQPQSITKPTKPQTPEEFEHAIALGLVGLKFKTRFVGHFAEKLHCSCGRVFYDDTPISEAYRRVVLCPFCFGGSYTPDSVMNEGNLEPSHWRDEL